MEAQWSVICWLLKRSVTISCIYEIDEKQVQQYKKAIQNAWKKRKPCQLLLAATG